MKTVLKDLDVQLELFAGTAMLEQVAKPSRFMDRARLVRLLVASKNSKFTNVETRCAFVAIAAHAEDKTERDYLLKLMGITSRTFYNWCKDRDAYLNGEIKVRTVVIRK